MSASPTESSHPLRTRLIEGVGWLLLALALALVNWLALATTFMPYDDEGYIQWSLREVTDGHALYSEVFSQYGPFFYAAHHPLAWLGYPFTSDAVRVITLIYWLGTAAASGWIVRFVTRSPLFGLLGFALTALALTRMNNEPGHPGGLLALLTALAAATGVRQLAGGRLGAFAGWQGVLIAAMFWTKINIGVFHLLATLCFWPLRGPINVPAGWRSTARILLPVLLGAALMSGLFPHDAVQQFWLLFVLVAASLACTTPRPWSDAAPPGLLARGAMGFGFMTVVAWGATAAGGTNLRDLWEGAILAPLQHPGVYHFPPSWRDSVLPLAGVSVACALVWKMGPARWRDPLLIGLKLVCIVILAFAALLNGLPNLLERVAFQWLPLLVWAIARPLSADEENPESRGRAWLGWMLCWHWLQAYPVAGTQTIWGTFLAVPLVILSAHDLLTKLSNRRWLRLATTTSLVGVILIAGARHTLLWSGHWKNGESPGLPGTHHLALAPEQSSTLAVLVENVRTNADMLFTFPGMLSFNQWSGLPPPTRANTTHWFSLLDAPRQREIIAALRTARRPLVIVQRGHFHLLTDAGHTPHSPLIDHLVSEFEPTLRIGDYEIWKRPHTPFVPVSAARAARRDDKVILTVISPAGDELQAIEFRRVGDVSIHAGWIGRKDDWRRIALPNSDPSSPPYRWVIPFSPNSLAMAPGDLELRLLGADDRLLDRVRLDRAPNANPLFNVSSPTGSD